MRHTKLATLLSFIVLASIAFIPALSDEVQAVGEITYVWDGEGGDNLASTAGNWYKNDGGTITDDVAPTNNSALVWNGTSTKVCTFDLDDSVFYAYSWSINAGYTGTITQGASADISIGAGGFTMSAGTFTGDTGKSVTCTGSWIRNSGTITSGKTCLIMAGEGKTLTSGGYLYDLTINGNTTWTTNAYLDRHLTIASGKTLTLSANLNYLYGYTSFNGAFSNSGTIAGTGTLVVIIQDSDETLTTGVINSPLSILAWSTSTANRLLTLTADATLGSTLTVKSDHATRTCTLDPAGYDITATSITVSTRGVLLGGEGDITTTSWDSSAGTWTPETSNVHFTGTGTIKTAAGQTFYNLTVGASASVTQSSNVVVSEWMELDGGAWTKGAYTLTAPLMTISSSITDTGTEDATYSYTPTADQPISSVSVVTNGTWLSIVGTTVVGTPTNTEVGTFYVNVTCTNVIGSVSQNSTITISNTAPVWTTTPSTEWSYGMTYSYDPSASDEGAGLTYSMTTSAIELRCDPTSGVIRGKVLDNSIKVSLMADDGNGGVIWQNWTITAMGFSWDGDVVVNYTEGQNLKVTFNASLTNATYNAIIKSVQWNFGDGNGSRVLDLMPMHPYERPGTYTVTVYIVTEDDMTATKNFQITVGDPAVVEDLNAQYTERMNQAVLISGLACAAGLVLIACYIKVAGRRGWMNRLVPVMILVAMLAISATLIGSAMQ